MSVSVRKYQKVTFVISCFLILLLLASCNFKISRTYKMTEFTDEQVGSIKASFGLPEDLDIDVYNLYVFSRVREDGMRLVVTIEKDGWEKLEGFLDEKLEISYVQKESDIIFQNEAYTFWRHYSDNAVKQSIDIFKQESTGKILCSYAYSVYSREMLEMARKSGVELDNDTDDDFYFPTVAPTVSPAPHGS